MTLQEAEAIAKIVSSIATCIILTISAGAAVFLYRWQRRLGKLNSLWKQNDDLRSYNLLVIETDSMLELERKNHRWGSLTKDETKKMYSLFIHVNVSYNMFLAKEYSSVDEDSYNSLLNNLSNTTFADKDFILQHVLPRGYKKSFRKEIIDRWDKIAKNGTLSS